MSIIEVLHNRILSLRDHGMTNKEIGETCGLSQAHVNYLLNGPAERVASLKFATILRLFPDIARLLNSHLNTNGSAIADNGSAAAVNGNAVVNNPPANTSRLDVLMSQVVRSKMCDACKIVVLDFILKEKEAENTNGK